MNKKDRQLLDHNQQRVTTAKSLLELTKEDLDKLQVQEQKKYDNLSPGLQEADNGQRIQQAADELESAVMELETVLSGLDTALEHIKEADPA